MILKFRTKQQSEQWMLTDCIEQIELFPEENNQRHVEYMRRGYDGSLEHGKQIFEGDAYLVSDNGKTIEIIFRAKKK